MKSSTGGVEDSTHLGPLASQFVVFSNGLLRLQDSDVDTFLLHKVQRGGGNLGEETTAQTDLRRVSTESISVTFFSRLSLSLFLTLLISLGEIQFLLVLNARKHNLKCIFTYATTVTVGP